jgi:hypothetical protein
MIFMPERPFSEAEDEESIESKDFEDATGISASLRLGLE